MFVPALPTARRNDHQYFFLNPRMCTRKSKHRLRILNGGGENCPDLARSQPKLQLATSISSATASAAHLNKKLEINATINYRSGLFYQSNINYNIIQDNSMLWGILGGGDRQAGTCFHVCVRAKNVYGSLAFLPVLGLMVFLFLNSQV